MKSSFDGIRKNLSHGFNAFADSFMSSDAKEMPDWAYEILIDKLNDMRSYIVGLQCMYDPNDPNDCNEIDIPLVDVYEGTDQ